MNRNLIIAVVVAAAAAGGLYYWTEMHEQPAERVPEMPVVAPTPHIETPFDAPVPDESVVQGPPTISEMPEEPVLSEGPVEQVEEAEIEVKPIGEIDIEDRPELANAFETALDELLEKVTVMFNEYQKERVVMTDMVKDENLRNPEYVAENAEMMDELTASLRAKSQEVLDVFTAADAQIRTLIEEMPEEEQEELTLKWEALVMDHAGAYHAFFEDEENMAQAHAAIMRFYYRKRGTYHYDEETQSIVFDNPSDQEFARLLRTQINRMRRTQNMTINRGKM